MAKVPRPAYPDFVYNRCLIGKSKSGWSWACLDCGEGSIWGKAKYYRDISIQSAKDHRCKPDEPAQP